MYRANLTWPLTIAYLGVFLKNQMVSVENFEKRRIYRITPKGSSLLKMYTGLQDAASELGLDKVDLKEISKAMSTRRAVTKRGASVDSVRELLVKAGHTILDNVLKGGSGVEHSFNLVASNKEGARTGYLIKDSVPMADVIRAFVMQTDCEIQVCIICNEHPQKEASALAESYGLRIILYRDLSSADSSELS